jgi:hypothetical protein
LLSLAFAVRVRVGSVFEQRLFALEREKSISAEELSRRRVLLAKLTACREAGLMDRDEMERRAALAVEGR